MNSILSQKWIFIILVLYWTNLFFIYIRTNTKQTNLTYPNNSQNENGLISSTTQDRKTTDKTQQIKETENTKTPNAKEESNSYDIYEVDSNELNFVIFGDYGANSIEQKQVAEAIINYAETTPLDFAISTGDNFYYYGLRKQSDIRQFEKILKNYENPAIPKLYAIPGNHDCRGNLNFFSDLEKTHSIWDWALNRPHRLYKLNDFEANFHFLDTCYLSCLDSTFSYPQQCEYWSSDAENSPFVKNSFKNITETAKKMLKDLSSSIEKTKSSKYHFVTGHNSPFTTQADRGDQKNLISNLLPFLNNIDSYFAGHDHNLQVLENENIFYLISGSAGYQELHSLDEKLTKANIQFIEKTNGFMHLKLEKESWHLKVLDKYNTVLYEKTIFK